MALLDPYLSKTEYESFAVKGRVIASAAWAADDLTGASRCLDHLLGLAPGAINSATGTRVFSGNGKATLWLRDGLGQHLLRTVDTDGVAIDTDDDGSAEYTIDPTGETWLVGLPRNAAAFSEPWDRLQFISRPTAELSEWPEGDFNVAITGTWGYAAVPAGIKAIVQDMVRDMREVQTAGRIAWDVDGAQALPLRDNTWRRIRELKTQFSYRSGVRVA